MKPYLFFAAACAALAVLGGCASGQKAANSCLILDERVGFARCETAEVICYEGHGGQACWPKPEPAKPSPATPSIAPPALAPQAVPPARK